MKEGQMLYEAGTDLPPLLEKSLVDPYCYLMGLRDGTRIMYGHAVRHGDWLHLSTPEFDGDFPDELAQLVCRPSGRGLDVRLRDVVWVADSES